jgi:hypothetical protein
VTLPEVDKNPGPSGSHGISGKLTVSPKELTNTFKDIYDEAMDFSIDNANAIVEESWVMDKKESRLYKQKVMTDGKLIGDILAKQGVKTVKVEYDFDLPERDPGDDEGFNVSLTLSSPLKADTSFSMTANEVEFAPNQPLLLEYVIVIPALVDMTDYEYHV